MAITAVVVTIATFAIVVAVAIVLVAIVVIIYGVVVAIGAGAEVAIAIVGRATDWRRNERIASLVGPAPWPFSSPSGAGSNGSSAYLTPLLQRNNSRKGQNQLYIHSLSHIRLGFTRHLLGQAP